MKKYGVILLCLLAVSCKTFQPAVDKKPPTSKDQQAKEELRLKNETEAAGFLEKAKSLYSEHKPAEGGARPTLRSLEAVDRALLRASTTEIARLEHRIAFLATTASITPYIGLFGTVWGIMTAFQAIAGAGSTSLGVVGPPIAEALLATALGLFAAIPAVYFYNDLTSHVKAFVNEMEDFSLEFLTIAERNFT